MAGASVNTQGSLAGARSGKAMLRRCRNGKNHRQFPPGSIGPSDQP
jgi:hypothetical protein